MATRELVLFSGSSVPKLADMVALELGTPLGKAEVGRFSDGEISVEIQESVRGMDVFVIQSTCAPANDNIIELIIMIDALKRSSAQRITAVIPYFGYSRQDRRPRSRVPISAKAIADILTGSGIDRICTFDLHADQIQGFFNIPVDNVYASSILVQDALAQQHQNPVVVSPDVGGVVRARALAKQINDTDIAIIDKRRGRPNESEVMNVIGDVEGRTALIIDDIVDTAGTLCNAASALKDIGATRVVAYVTHPVFSGPAIARIGTSVLDEVVVTNTIPLSTAAQTCAKIRQLNMSHLIAESIRRISNEESVSVLNTAPLFSALNP